MATSKGKKCATCGAPNPYHTVDCAAVRAKVVAEINREKEHNGWTNYETWVVNLWIDNEEPLSIERRDRVREIIGNNVNEVSVCCEAETSTEVEQTETAVHSATVCDNCGKECATQKAVDTDAAIGEVADWLKAWIGDEIPETYFEDTVNRVMTGALGPYCDLLNAALSEVDWREIARHDVDNEKADVLADATADA